MTSWLHIMHIYYTYILLFGTYIGVITIGETSTYPYMKWIGHFVTSTRSLVLISDALLYSSVLITIGLFTRLAGVVSLISFSILFHQDTRWHNNHYIFIIWILIVAQHIPWGQQYSVDSFVRQLYYKYIKKGSTHNVPCSEIYYWKLWTMQFLYMVPYFFGGIAKMQWDWVVRQQPIRNWVVGSMQEPGAHFKNWLLKTPIMPYFLCWGGVLFDLSEPVILFSVTTIVTVMTNKYSVKILNVPKLSQHLSSDELKKLSSTKRVMFFIAQHRFAFLALTFAGSLSFNCINKWFMDIGVFPYAMIWSLVMFLPPGTLNTYLCRVSISKSSIQIKKMTKKSSVENAKQQSVDSSRLPPFEALSPSRKLYGPIFVACFVIFHVLYPIRSKIFSPPFVSWHEEGHLHAWNMKLRSKHGFSMLHVSYIDHDDPKRRVQTKTYAMLLDPSIGETKAQKAVYDEHPYYYHNYLKYLRKVHMLAGYDLVKITSSGCFELNERPSQKMYKEDVNILDYLDTYWYPFNTCVGKWVWPLQPLSFFGEEKLEPTDPTYCEVDDFKLKLAKMDFKIKKNYYDLHERAGILFKPAMKLPGRELEWERETSGRLHDYLNGGCMVHIIVRRKIRGRVTTANNNNNNTDSTEEMQKKLVTCLTFFRSDLFNRVGDDVVVVNNNHDEWWRHLAYYNITNKVQIQGEDFYEKLHQVYALHYNHFFPNSPERLIEKTIPLKDHVNLL